MEVCVYHALDSINEINRKMPDITLRDLFAMNALPSAIELCKNSCSSTVLYDYAAKEAYNFADAMMQARKKN